MTVTISFPPDLESTLRQQAARSGQEVSAFVLDAVKEKIAKARTLDEVCAPFARAVTAAGISDEEFDEFFEQSREEVWQEKQDQAR
jgi:hypothetical protein